MPEYCAAYACKNRRTIVNKGRGITFHKFPKHLRKKWEVALRRKGFTATKSSVLCSEHFKQEDFDRTGQTVRLRDGVIPSIFSFPVHLQKSKKGRTTSTSKKAAEIVSVAPQDDADPSTSHSQPQPNDDHSYVLPASPTALKARLPEPVARVERLERAKKKAMAIPLSSLRLLVPPLRLLSAAMWQVAKQRDVLQYDKLQEFVGLVTEAVPGLMGCRQRSQLLLALRARLVLELCRDPVDSRIIQSHLERLPTIPSGSTGFRDAEVELAESTFVALVQSLLKDASERAYFFQEVFPVEYGPMYDTALQSLLWEFLSRLERMFPIPDIIQTAAWLSSAPSVLGEPWQSTPEELHLIHQHHKNSGIVKVPYGPSSSVENCILSALSVPPSQRVKTEVVESAADEGNGQASKKTVSAVEEASLEQKQEALTNHSLEIDTVPSAAELASEYVSGESDSVSKKGREMWQRQQESLYVLSEGAETSRSSQSDTQHKDSAISAEEREDGSGLAGFSKTQHAVLSNVQRSTGLQTRTMRGGRLKRQNKLSEKKKEHDKEEKVNNADVLVAPSVIAIRGNKTDDSEEVTSIIFSCPQCPFHKSAENSPPHIHIQDVPTEEYSNHIAAGSNGASFTPSPCSTDQIFTSIKMFPSSSSFQIEQQNTSSSTARGVPLPSAKGKQKCLTCECPFECSHCSKRFTLISIRTRHERMHIGERPFLCSQCGKGFLSQGELSKHHRSHVDDRPYPCSLCEKRFKSKRAQQEHIVSHTGVRPYPCTFCGKGFSKPYALTRHHLIHTGERPFPCSHCEKTFLTLGEAQLHERIHTGERPYPCSVCEMKFKSSSELARHKRCHAGVRPARPNCHLCSKSFTSKAKLRKHIESHSGTEGEADIEAQASNI